MTKWFFRPADLAKNEKRASERETGRKGEVKSGTLGRGNTGLWLPKHQITHNENKVGLV